MLTMFLRFTDSKLSIIGEDQLLLCWKAEGVRCTKCRDASAGYALTLIHHDYL